MPLSSCLVCLLQPKDAVCSSVGTTIHGIHALEGDGIHALEGGDIHALEGGGLQGSLLRL